MSIQKYPFGRIIYHTDDDSHGEVQVIEGFSSVSPKFINKIDESLWESYWKTRGKVFGAEYVHGQDRFDKVKPYGSWSQAEADASANNVKNLIESYSAVSEAYNKDVAEPFIKERKSLLDKIFKSNR